MSVARRSFLSRLVPPPWRAKVPVVPVIRLSGTIGSVLPLRTGLSLGGVNDVLERAFQRKGIVAVALAVNSPGGSAVQASLIAARIRELAARNELRVFTFIEDVAASGGYWLACAGDEIYADSSSIVGSIGVVSASFGFVEAIRKLGIERRVHTVGENKAILDPFRPERPEDVERLKALQLDVHEEFKTLVRTRRAGRLDEANPDLFTGAFWSGRRAMELGLIDGIGSMHQILKERYGQEVVLKIVERSQALWWRRLLPFGNGAPHEALIDAIETRILMSRFGL
jgi:signal peptide peptidase SppA